jgi:hypothetical protein
MSSLIYCGFKWKDVYLHAVKMVRQLNLEMIAKPSKGLEERLELFKREVESLKEYK